MTQSGDEFEDDIIDLESLDLNDITDDVANEDAREWNKLSRLSIDDLEKEKKIFYLHLEKPSRAASESAMTVASLARNKLDSRTFVRPKKASNRPSLEAIVDASPVQGTVAGFTSRFSAHMQGFKNLTPEKFDKYLTYNKYNSPFTIGAGDRRNNSMTASQDPDDLFNSSGISLVESFTTEPPNSSKPIQIDLTQPTNNYSAFRRGCDMRMSARSEREKNFTSISPPSLVTSIVDDEEFRKSINGTSRESLDNHQNSLMSSMTMSILDDKDMNTSFLSTTTQQDYDSLGSVSASLISSINSSYSAQNLMKKPEELTKSFAALLKKPEPLITSISALLEPSERLMDRPRMSFKNVTQRINNTLDEKNDKIIDNNEIDLTKDDSNTDCDNRNVKENPDSSFEVYNNHPLLDIGRNSMNVTLDKRELNEIIQAREKLSFARSALPKSSYSPNKTQTLIERESISQAKIAAPLLIPTKLNQTVDLNNTKDLHERSIELKDQTIRLRQLTANQTTDIGDKTIQINTTRTINDPRKSLDNISGRNNSIVRESPKRNGTFRMMSPARSEATIVYVKDKDSNFSPLETTANCDRTLTPDEWRNERAMVGSSESTDVSSASPPEVTDHYANAAMQQQRLLQVSTPLSKTKTNYKSHDSIIKTMHSISPILTSHEATVEPVKRNSPLRSGLQSLNLNKIDSTTMVRRRKEGGPNPTKSENSGFANAASHQLNKPARSGLPKSKQRQYSSHRDLRMTGAGTLGNTRSGGPVYGSNPAISPTQPLLLRKNSYTIATQERDTESRPRDRPPTLLREATFKRPQSQLITPREIRTNEGFLAPANVVRRRSSSQQGVPTLSRPSSVSSHTQIAMRVKPAAVTQKPVSSTAGRAPAPEQRYPAPEQRYPAPEQRYPAPEQRYPAPEQQRVSRASRLLAPRIITKPACAYSAAPSAGDMGEY